MGLNERRKARELQALKNVTDKAAKKITFEDGVLEMHCAYARGLDGAFSDSEIRELLIAKL